MPYKNKQDLYAAQKRYRERKKTSQHIQNRLRYLESEIKRLQKCLEVALRGSAVS
jgi:cell shape-determining protein MreC